MTERDDREETGTTEYRDVPDEDLPEFQRQLAYAFRPTEAFEGYESADEIPNSLRIGAPRGLYVEDEIVSTVKHFWFDFRVRGELHSVGGIGVVSTPPTHRRKGYTRELLAASLREYRERDVHFSALWPFSFSFYRRLGWGKCTEGAVIRCPPDALSFVDGGNDAGGSFTTLDADRWEELAAVHEAGSDHALYMDRSEEWWRKQMFPGPYVAGWEVDDELRGYLIYSIKNDSDRGERVLSIKELVGCDHEATIELYRFCRDHDSQVDSVVIHGQHETMLHELASDPSAIEIEAKPGAMFRVVDVENALSALSTPTGADGSVVLGVEDPIAPWNNGSFSLSANGCETTTEEPDVRLGIQTLSKLAVGSLSVQRAELVDDMSIENEGARRMLDRLFPPEETYLREHF